MDNKFYEVFSKYDTDKINYCEAYEECFGDIRDDIRLIFEIGVNRGGSVRAWKEYFPNALIVGLEKKGHLFFEEERIKIETGNATRSNFLSAVMTKHGWPDIVIDDGSHKSKDIKASYGLLYPYTQKCYVIEDLSVQTPDVQNGFFINDGEPATSVVHKNVDNLLLYRTSCKSIKVYHSIVFFFV